MIYFLYGEDTYRSRAKVREIVAEFQKKAGTHFNVTRIDVADRPEAVFSVGRTGSLFGEKELAVIENSGSAKGAELEYIKSGLKRWKGDKDFTVIFWERGAEKSGGLFTSIKEAAAKSQEFKTLTQPSFLRWLNGELTRRGMRLSAEEQGALGERFGADLWATTQELDKIRDGWSIARTREREEKIWTFTDAFSRHRRRAFPTLANLLAGGYDSLYLVASLAGALRALALAWRGANASKLKNMTAGLNPWVAQKSAELARGTDGEALRARFAALSKADEETKTGVLPAPLPIVKLTLKR